MAIQFVPRPDVTQVSLTSSTVHHIQENTNSVSKIGGLKRPRDIENEGETSPEKRTRRELEDDYRSFTNPRICKTSCVSDMITVPSGSKAEEAVGNCGLTGANTRMGKIAFGGDGDVLMEDATSEAMSSPREQRTLSPPVASLESAANIPSSACTISLNISGSVKPTSNWATAPNAQRIVLEKRPWTGPGPTRLRHLHDLDDVPAHPSQLPTALKERQHSLEREIVHYQWRLKRLAAAKKPGAKGDTRKKEERLRRSYKAVRRIIKDDPQDQKRLNIRCGAGTPGRRDAPMNLEPPASRYEYHVLQAWWDAEIVPKRTFCGSQAQATLVRAYGLEEEEVVYNRLHHHLVSAHRSDVLAQVDVRAASSKVVRTDPRAMRLWTECRSALETFKEERKVGPVRATCGHTLILATDMEFPTSSQPAHPEFTRSRSGKSVNPEPAPAEKSMRALNGLNGMESGCLKRRRLICSDEDESLAKRARCTIGPEPSQTGQGPSNEDERMEVDAVPSHPRSDAMATEHAGQGNREEFPLALGEVSSPANTTIGGTESEASGIDETNNIVQKDDDVTMEDAPDVPTAPATCQFGHLRVEAHNLVFPAHPHPHKPYCEVTTPQIIYRLHLQRAHAKTANNSHMSPYAPYTTRYYGGGLGARRDAVSDPEQMRVAAIHLKHCKDVIGLLTYRDPQDKARQDIHCTAGTPGKRAEPSYLKAPRSQYKYDLYVNDRDAVPADYPVRFRGHLAKQTVLRIRGLEMGERKAKRLHYMLFPAPAANILERRFPQTGWLVMGTDQRAMKTWKAHKRGIRLLKGESLTAKITGGAALPEARQGLLKKTTGLILAEKGKNTHKAPK
ncbi:hypothetical protein BD413DRAFT_681157 [Trametes elegans]|nr:hypothetical protein BD413DRAFT_681157 [Trametes elegans]